MRVLIYGINYWPELTGVGKYTAEMGQWLSDCRHDIRIVTAPPYYPQWRVAPGYANRYKCEILDRQVIYRCPIWIPQKLHVLNRITHLLSFLFSSAPVILWQALRWRPTMIITIQPPLITAPVAYTAARIAGAKTWMHIQDYELDTAFGLGMMTRPWLKAALQGFERFFMRRFDRVSTISNRMMEQLSRKGVRDGRAVFFKNWVDTQYIFPLTGPSPFRASLSISSEDVVALYSGNMGRKQGLEMLLDAARSLAHEPHIKFVLAGEGSMRSALEKLALGMKNVSFLPLQPVERLNDLLNMSDIHLLLQRPQTSDFLMPSKLTGMLASGRPIVATVHLDSELAKTIEGCSIVVPPEDSKALAAAILELAGNSAKRRLLGQRGRSIAVSLFDKQTVLQEFENQLCASGLQPS